MCRMYNTISGTKMAAVSKRFEFSLWKASKDQLIEWNKDNRPNWLTSIYTAKLGIHSKTHPTMPCIRLVDSHCGYSLVFTHLTSPYHTEPRVCRSSALLIWQSGNVYNLLLAHSMVVVDVYFFMRGVCKYRTCVAGAICGHAFALLDALQTVIIQCT